MRDLVPFLVIASRVCIGGFFLVAGIRNTRHVDAIVAQLRRPVPQPRLLVIAGTVLQIVAGAMVTFSLWPALGALGLIAFLGAAVFLFHDFWNAEGAEREAHINSVLPDVALLGAFLAIIAGAI